MVGSCCWDGFLGEFFFWLIIDYRLQAECARLGIEIHRRVFKHIDEALELYPEVDAVFNCTGLGALTLGGVEDQKMYPSRVSNSRSQLGDNY